MEGSPVIVVFFKIPVAKDANVIPLILPTTVASCGPLTSPDKLPVNPAEFPTL